MKNATRLILPDTVGISPFNLSDFMRAQEDGLFFDLTKIDRFFQENTGPTLADDVGEPIGLALSQRAWNGQTLAELLAGQTELVTNGDFAVNDLTPYTASNATLAIAGGRLSITATANATAARASRTFAVTAGRLYRLEVVGRKQSAGGATAGAYVSGVGNTEYNNSTTDLSRVAYLVASSSSMTVNLDLSATGGTIGQVFSVDTFSLKEVPGKHGIQATGTLQPTRQTTGAKFDGIDDNWLTSYTAGAGDTFVLVQATIPVSIPVTQMILGARETSVSTRCYLVINTSGVIGGGVGSQDESTIIDTNGTDYRGQEVVIGLTLGATVRLFVNDAQVYEGAPSGNAQTAQPWRIGARNVNGSASNFFGGSIKKLVAGRQFLDLATYLKIRTALLAA
jgi:hypothetical protein